ncbi:MAG: Hsp20/alpha crystallin family protein [Planctomycetota bacterium]
MSEMVKKDAGSDMATVEQTRTGPNYILRCDLIETDDELLLYGDLPGVTPENLDLRFENDRLMIHGKVEPRHQDHELVYGEYGVGDYHREFQIFEQIDANKISAELNNGVLCVHLPKSEAVKPCRIEVKGG